MRPNTTWSANMKHITQLLKIANAFEDSGQGFFSRSGNDMYFYIRATRVNDPEQWPNAHDLHEQLSYPATPPEHDRLSGHLVIRYPNAYKVSES